MGNSMAEALVAARIEGIMPEWWVLSMSDDLEDAVPNPLPSSRRMLGPTRDPGLLEGMLDIDVDDVEVLCPSPE